MNKNLTRAILIWSILIAFIAFGLIKVNKEKNELEENSIFSTAIIVKAFVGAKGLDYVEYEFLVDSSVFNGHQRYYPQFEKVEIGDSFIVVYNSLNPEISMLSTDNNNRLKKLKKQ
jgi:hypothetical protein